MASILDKALHSEEEEGSGKSRPLLNVLQDGSQPLRAFANVERQIADLQVSLSELAKTCSNLKEPAKNLTWLPFVGGGLGLCGFVLRSL